MDNSSQTIAFQMFLQMFGEDCLCDKNGCLEAYKYKNLTQEQAQKSNTSKGTMNVELNGTKPFLRLVIIYFVFVSVLKVVVVLLYSAFKR